VELSEQGSGAMGFVPGMSPGYGGLFRPVASAPSVVNPFRFAGQVGGYRIIANWVDMRARIFLAICGRWPSRDELGQLAGPNEYAFVGNNPVNAVDPAGFDQVAATFDGPAALLAYPMPNAAQLRKVPAPKDFPCDGGKQFHKCKTDNALLCQYGNPNDCCDEETTTCCRKVAGYDFRLRDACIALANQQCQNASGY